MSVDQTAVTPTPAIILEEKKLAEIKKTKKMVAKYVGGVALLITGLVVVERITRVDIDETDEIPNED